MAIRPREKIAVAGASRIPSRPWEGEGSVLQGRHDGVICGKPCCGCVAWATLMTTWR